MQQMNKVFLMCGPDSSGKGTLLNYLRTKLTNVQVFKFPSGEFRKKIMEKARPQKEIVEIFAQDFAHNLPRIKESIASGHNVIIDRMYLSTLVYAMQDGVSEKYVMDILKKYIGNWRADYELITSIKPEIAHQRLAERVLQTGETNWLDGDLKKQREIIALYDKYIDDHKNDQRVIKIDTNGSIENTYKQINQFIKTLQNTTTKQKQP